MRSVADEHKRCSDAELLDRFVSIGDPAALEALVRRHARRVYAAARVLANPADAEDVFQATFLALIGSAARVRRGGSVAGWLTGVAHRLALKALRARARSRRREEAAA